MYVLTEEYNDYDQHGEYFIEAFAQKPSRELLEKILKEHGYPMSEMGGVEYVDHVLHGGGRRADHEYVWHYLRECVLRDAFGNADHAKKGE